MNGITIIQLESGYWLAMGDNLFRLAEMLKNGKICNCAGIGESPDEALESLRSDNDIENVINFLDEIYSDDSG